MYRLGEEGEEAQPVLRQTFAGTASSWTPSLDRCLERGGRYAWAVQSVGQSKAGTWSSPRLFEIASPPGEAMIGEGAPERGREPGVRADASGASAAARPSFGAGGAAAPEGALTALESGVAVTPTRGLTPGPALENWARFGGGAPDENTG